MLVQLCVILGLVLATHLGTRFTCHFPPYLTSETTSVSSRTLGSLFSLLAGLLINRLRGVQEDKTLARASHALTVVPELA